MSLNYPKLSFSFNLIQSEKSELETFRDFQRHMFWSEKNDLKSNSIKDNQRFPWK
jgi:hypothetical protein